MPQTLQYPSSIVPAQPGCVQAATPQSYTTLRKASRQGKIIAMWHRPAFFTAVFVCIGIAACGGGKFTSASAPSDASTGDTGVPLDAASGGDASCAPKECPDLKWICGIGDDTCGSPIDCGACGTVGYRCIDHACVCAKKTCQTLGFQCGTAPDGCGGVVTCAACPTEQNCGGGGANKCGTGTCTPATCAHLGAQCGKVSDGCGNTIDCGTCKAPDTCGGSGTANQCGCTGQTCAAMGWQCGTGDNGCGQTLLCPSCPPGTACGPTHSCAATTCVPDKTCASESFNCGSFTDSCNVVQTCGPPPGRDLTGDFLCVDASLNKHFLCPCTVPQGMGGTLSDASTATCGAGPTPPEPTMDCVAAPPPADGWCCK